MLKNRLFKLISYAAFCTIGIGATPLVNAQAYTLTDLGLGDALGINNVAQVIGWNGARQTVIWNGTTATVLDSGGRPNDINDAGQVVGQNRSGEPVVWNGTTPTVLGYFGVSGGTAVGINNLSQVVGEATGGAVIWNGTTPIYLRSGNSGYSVAGDINEAGKIVGLSTNGTAVWNSINSFPTLLGAGTGFSPSALAINNAGQVVGSVNLSPGGNTQAVLWNGTIPTILGGLGGFTLASDINNVGQIVGNSAGPPTGLPSSNTGHAVLWQGGAIQDLNNVLDSSGLGWTLETASAINDAGQIVGRGINQFGEPRRAFLLTFCESCQSVPWSPSPIPEPETYALLLAGLGLLGVVARRRKQSTAKDVMNC